MSKYRCAALLALLLAGGWRAAAADGDSTPLAPLLPEIVIAVADPDGFAPPVAPAELGALRGGADTVSNTMRLDGTVSGNTAVNVQSGANAIGGGSFGNATGLPIAIQNSGANVLIQNATIIHIEMQ